MSTPNQRYCLDANVLIEAWQKYYSPAFCPEYWNIINHLGETNRIFLPKMVYDEIANTEDELSTWLSSSRIPIIEITSPVTECLRRIYETHSSHKFLADNTRQRSLADPWVIAHALNENACVVTKETKQLNPSSPKVRIPNVCENMGITCIDDFAFIRTMNITFNCVM